MNKKTALVINLVSVLIVAGWLLSNAGRYLAYTQPPVHADVIIVLSGDGGRLEKGIQLYREGYADRLLLTNAAEFQRYEPTVYNGTYLVAAPEAPVIREDQADSTYQNALYARKLLRTQGDTYSAIVVSSDYHMRRVKFLFDRVFRGTGIQLTYCAANSGYHPARWWAYRKDTRTTGMEYLKWIANAFGVQGREAKDLWYGSKGAAYGEE